MARKMKLLNSLKEEEENERIGKKSGTALWAVGSFMNHNTTREVFGKLMVVHAAIPLKAG